MTLKKLNDICKRYGVPDDVKLLDDSGWECGDTEMDGVFWNEERNEIVFTQDASKEYKSGGRNYYSSSEYREEWGWKELNPREVAK